MRRYALCAIEGTGAFGDPFRSKVTNYSRNAASLLADTGPDGHPTKTYALSIFTRDDMGPVLADADIYLFPDLGLSTEIAILPQADKDALTAALDAHGIDRTALDGSWPLADVLVLVGRSLHAGFTLNNFSVPDI